MTGAVFSVAGFTKRYGRTTAVNDLTFTAEPGRVTALLGPNGAGKTTTLRALLGLVRPTSGSVTVNGRPYRDLIKPITVVGAVLDATVTHPASTGRDHLRVICRSARLPERRADETLERVGLSDVASRRASGYSLGMRQRLGIGVALLGDPQGLILDEPTIGLDPSGIRWLRGVLRELADAGRTVLVSSHGLAEMSTYADAVVIVSKGALVAAGSMKDLIGTYGDLERAYLSLTEAMVS
ncbi:MAG: ABC transporter ATP-binding protein [Micromonosporaceae bacterium]